MITLPSAIDLGGDKNRMTDQNDVRRQTRTAAEILRRFFAAREDERTEIQVLADEVGMGKTFVALAVAYSVLHMMRNDAEPELAGCYRKVLVLTPSNDALFKKWTRETGEFAKVCVRQGNGGEAEVPFRSQGCDSIDDFVKALRTPNGPGMLVLKMGRLGSGGFRHRDSKYQFMLAALCRYLGNRLPRDTRTVVLRRAPSDWPRDDSALGAVFGTFREQMHFSDDECATALATVDQEPVAEILATLKELGKPGCRDRREQRFDDVRGGLSRLYKEVCYELIRRDLPLVIVDEAHNWKNGPDHGANGYGVFRDRIACHTRRALMLTATPFQLAPSEMLNILDPVGYMHLPNGRREYLRGQCGTVLRQVLEASQSASRVFARAWSMLPDGVRPTDLEEKWRSAPFEIARRRLKRESERGGALEDKRVSQVIREATDGVHPDVRGFFEASLRLYAHNADLSAELGRFVIRHRRSADHRLVRVGSEFIGTSEEVSRRPDRTVLHIAPGIDVSGEGELPHYMLMRAVSESKKGKGRTSLGAGLTGTYSTLFESREGRSLTDGGLDRVSRLYTDLLREWADESRDPSHPKVCALVDEVFRAWKRGEKYLIFCFRVHTARRLRAILKERIEKEIANQRKRLLESDRAFENLRARFTARERDLIPAVLDRVLWSWAIGRRAAGDSPGFGFGELRPQREDYRLVAQRLLEYDVDVRREQYDRVFLHRAVEHAIATRLIRQGRSDQRLERLLRKVSSRTWLELPYAITPVEAQESDESLQLQRRGVHWQYSPALEAISRLEIDELAEELIKRDQTARAARRLGPVDGVALSANLWVGLNPAHGRSRKPSASPLLELHKHLWKLMGDVLDESVWHDRLHLFAAFRRAVLRESTLVRLLPERDQRRSANWASLLADRVAQPMPGQRESFLGRLAAFAEDYAARSGGLARSNSMRWSLMDATLLRDESLVALVDGSTNQEQRDRIFSGFNTPLLPDVLICTSVGQEGIDLHRHCRHVAHYDLAWNPAVMEQRTGRADRIGSKTFRERAVELRERRPLSFLHVGVPYLAGTYDERIYEELRLRSQTFEMLTGGSFSADHADLADDGRENEGRARGLRAVTLPATITDDLRVNLGL